MNEKIEICVAIKRNMFVYNISKLIRTVSGFDTVFIDSVRCSDVGIAKYAVTKSSSMSTRINKGHVVYVISSFSGDKYYYHPRYRRWFKNLTDEQLEHYFGKLLP